MMRVMSLCAAIALAFAGSAAAAETPTAIMTVNPIVLNAQAQNKDLVVRVTAPVTGDKLPIILFSHGYAYSKDDYLPLAEFWAAHGYVVFQPTHIDSKALNLPQEDQRVKDAWRTRPADLRLVLDSLDTFERLIPALKGRIDRTKVLTAGHSYGGQTASVLIGAHVFDPVNDVEADLADPRVMAAIIMASPGFGPGMRKVSWAQMTKPALVIVGDLDVNTLKNEGWAVHADPYKRAPAGEKCLAAMAGVKHYLGGTLGTNRTEEETPNSGTIAEIQRISLAFLNTWAKGSKEWPEARAGLLAKTPAVYRSFECK